MLDITSVLSQLLKWKSKMVS